MSNKDHDYKGVDFTMGPIYFHQFNSFIKHGVGAIKLFQYIKTKQGLTKKSWVKVDNVNAYKWFGLSSSTNILTSIGGLSDQNNRPLLTADSRYNITLNYEWRI